MAKALIEVKRRKSESTAALLYRFSKRVKRAGIAKEVRKKQFHKRKDSDLKKRLSAKHREEKRKEIERMKKLGLM